MNRFRVQFSVRKKRIDFGYIFFCFVREKESISDFATILNQDPEISTHFQHHHFIHPCYHRRYLRHRRHRRHRRCHFRYHRPHHRRTKLLRIKIHEKMILSLIYLGH